MMPIRKLRMAWSRPEPEPRPAAAENSEPAEPAATINDILFVFFLLLALALASTSNNQAGYALCVMRGMCAEQGRGERRAQENKKKPLHVYFKAVATRRT